MTREEAISTYWWVKDDWVWNFEDGWWIAFGEQFCEEMNAAIITDGYTNTTDEYSATYFEVVQCKEKFGELRFYCSYGPHIEDVIDRYSRKSRNTCGLCGKPATWMATGWIYPYCDECKEKITWTEKFISLKEL